jgi:hypothetical protein
MSLNSRPIHPWIPAYERVKKSQSHSLVLAGLDPAIQSDIAMLRFFLDGRVKHGHEKGISLTVSPHSSQSVPATLTESERLRRPLSRVDKRNALLAHSKR